MSEEVPEYVEAINAAMARAGRAAVALSELAVEAGQRDDNQEEAARLRGKLQGVSLVVQYIHEEMAVRNLLD